MSGPDRPIAEERRREARLWLAIVDEDIDVAIAAMRLSRRGAAAYHVQQAAEKAIKGLLVLAGEAFRRTHDLDDLAARLLPIYPQFAVQAEAVRHLSVWGVACGGIPTWRTRQSRCRRLASWSTRSPCLKISRRWRVL